VAKRNNKEHVAQPKKCPWDKMERRLKTFNLKGQRVK